MSSGLQIVRAALLFVVEIADYAASTENAVWKKLSKKQEVNVDLTIDAKSPYRWSSSFQYVKEAVGLHFHRDCSSLFLEDTAETHRYPLGGRAFRPSRRSLSFLAESLFLGGVKLVYYSSVIHSGMKSLLLCSAKVRTSPMPFIVLQCLVRSMWASWF